VDTPLSVCEERDPKNLYAKARRGEIRDFTGISSPYDVPENPELSLQTQGEPLESAMLVLDYLYNHDIIRA